VVKLYEYAIILQPLKKKEGGYDGSGEVLARGDVLATDEDKATILVSREIPDEHLEHLERVTLAVRPF